MKWLVIIAALTGAACSGSAQMPAFGGDDDQLGGDTSGDPGAGDGDGDGDSEPASETVHYIGRFTADHGFEWSGSSIVAQFSGTGVSVSISGAASTFETFIDGTRGASFDSPVDGRALATGLASGAHTVEVYRRSEALFGTTTFAGFTVSGGDLQSSTFPYARRLQFVGDSITCGYGDLGVNGTCDLDLTTESELVAYGGLTARALNAAHHVVAWSGKGMWRQYGDGATPSPEQMPELYERTLPSDASSTWDHGQYVPDVIVIDLGTNDWSGGDPGQPYEDAYIAFLTHLRSLYAEAHIFCTLGPMQNTAPALQHVQNVVAAMNDVRIYYLAFPAQLASDGLGCDYHPSTTTQQKMATLLEQAIRNVTGW